MRVRSVRGHIVAKPGRKHTRDPPQFSLLELVEPALLGRLVVAPAHDLRAVADAPVADVVVADLDDELGPQRDPFEVAAVRPARRLAAAALAGLVGRQLADELALARLAEAAAVPDLVDAPILAVEAEDD